MKNSKIKRIYFDMDGVLVDFVKKASTITAKSKSAFWEEVSKIGIDFWLTMDEISGIKELVKKLTEKGIEVNVLTKLPTADTGNAAEGKIRWLNSHFYNIFTDIIFTKKQKGLYAKEDSLLIDDKESNCNDWACSGTNAPAIYFDSRTEDVTILTNKISKFLNL